MNLFAELTREISDRPGSPVKREQYRRLALTDEELTPEALAKRKAARRRPNAALPVVDNPWGLTPVQAAIVTAIAAGEGASEIASRLDISPKTVEVHLQNAKERVEAHEGSPVNRVRMAVLWDRFTARRAA